MPFFGPGDLPLSLTQPTGPIYLKLAGGAPASPRTIMTIDEITENFSLLDDWDDRYRYLIELGRSLEPVPDKARTAANKVPGCASQVWLVTAVVANEAGHDTEGPVLRFTGDSDAHLVRGLIAILLAACSGKPAGQIVGIDVLALFDRLGLRDHLTPQRSNGFKAMAGRIRNDARRALAPALP
jgi:cysteine desulfuration protein SufE